jgi:hypothetical protein
MTNLPIKNNMKLYGLPLLFTIILYGQTHAEDQRIRRTEKVRDLVVVVRDKLGETIDGVELSAFSRSAGSAVDLRTGR